MLGYCTMRAKRRMVALLAATASLAITVPCAIADPTVIGVDGTTVHLPIDITDGALDVNHGELKKLPGYDVVTINYPRSLGLLTLGGPGYDESVNIGKAETIEEIKKAQNGDPSVPVKLACYSQGADVCTQVNDELRESGYDQSNVSYLLFGNVDNAEAGVKVRFPYVSEKGVFIPIAGITFGNATPTSASDAHITQLLYEYDFFARAPEYPLNLLTDLNAIVGGILEHGAYKLADPYAPSNIVSTTPDGRITNIMIPVNEVPLLTVARFLGMPPVVADVINPTLKAIIDTGYGPVPNSPGTYPTEATPFKLFPTKEKVQTDIKNVQKGLAESKEKLEAIVKSATPLSTVPARIPRPSTSRDLSDLSAESSAGQVNPSRGGGPDSARRAGKAEASTSNNTEAKQGGQSNKRTANAATNNTRHRAAKSSRGNS